MMAFYVSAAAVGTLLIVVFLSLMWRLIASTQVRGVDPDWLENFSIAMYRPMARLLSEDDVVFLRSQPGFEPGMERAFRAARRRVFRTYLQGLARDFNRLHLALRLMVLHSPEDRPDLAASLAKQKLLFFAALMGVHVRLQLYGLGIGAIDVRPLVANLERLRAEFQLFRPSAVSITA